MNKNNIQVGETYKIDIGEFALGWFFEVIRVTKIYDDHIEGYMLEYPSEPIGIKNEDLCYLEPLKVNR